MTRRLRTCASLCFVIQGIAKMVPVHAPPVSICSLLMMFGSVHVRVDRRFRLPQESVFALGQADISELPHGAAVLAVFPQTTTFYNAVIVTPPSKRNKREYVLVFDEDEWRGLAPARKVKAKLVLPHPD